MVRIKTNNGRQRTNSRQSTVDSRQKKPWTMAYGLWAKGGFTLIELMLVVIIISILAAVVFPRFVGRTEQARQAAAKLQIKNLSLALETFELDNGHFPTTEEGLEALRLNPGNTRDWRGPYLRDDIPVDPWNNPYVYVCPGAHGDFDLESYGPDAGDGGGDDVESWTSGASRE